jgi:ABC-type arginine transport system permease subunit
LLTGIASLFLATVGATLVATARARNEDTTEMLRATLIAAIPGMILVAFIFYGLVNAWLGSRGA